MAAARKQTRNSQYYVGEVRNQIRNGFGVYVYPNSFFRYEGEWHKGEKHGHGKLLMKDGSYYEGEFVNGEIEGNGLRYWAKSGSSYSGQFSGGELHGYGVMQRGNGERFEGEFCYGLREGHGLQVDHDGQTYEGSFHQDKRHGEGHMQYRNGDQYEGSWLLDQRQGHGVMHFGDGSMYEGQWRNNGFNGQGTMIHCSGVIYEGMWTNGRPSGCASKMVIEGGDVLEVFQGSPFTVEVQLQTKERKLAAGENGRALQISAGVRLPDISHSSPPSSLSKIMEESTEKTSPAPFGFEFISYPLMERAFESRGSRGTAPLAVAKSGFAQADSPFPEGEWESGSGSDSVALGGGTPSYLDGKAGCAEQSADGESNTITESHSGLLTGQEEEVIPPPANQRTEKGQAKFQDLMLAPPPPDFKPFVLTDELEKRNAKKPPSKASSDKHTQDRSESSRANVAGRAANVRKSGLDSRTVRPGEYVIVVTEVTSPPFLGNTVPPAFALLRVLPAKNKSKTCNKDRIKSK